MSIEEKFERWISNRDNVERTVLKALPILSSGFLVAGFGINTKTWKYAFLSYAGIFASSFLYCKYARFKERMKRHSLGEFMKYVMGLYGTREKA